MKIIFVLFLFTLSLFCAETPSAIYMNNLSLFFQNNFYLVLNLLIISSMFLFYFVLRALEVIIFFVLIFILVNLNFLMINSTPDKKDFNFEQNIGYCTSGYQFNSIENKCIKNLDNNFNVDNNFNEDMSFIGKEPNVNIVNNGTANININTYTGPVTIIYGEKK